MKKIILLTVPLAVILLLAACSGGAPAEEDEAPEFSSSSALNMDYENAMPPTTQLTLGTFKLDETPYAVDAQQASELLPLWKAVRALSESDTVAQEEITAIYTQIEESMTSEQIDAIAKMELTREDMMAFLQEQGIEFGPGGIGRLGDLTPEQQETAQAARESGQGRGGFFPGGGQGLGGGPGGFGDLTPEQRQTAIAQGGGEGRGAGLRANSMFLDPLIDFLEAKTP
jgi:hypothetical protein